MSMVPFRLPAALVGAWLVVFSSPTCAQNFETAFAQANRLYEQGKFAEAASAFERLRVAGPASPALLFNLGNAHFKAGHVGLAVASYLEAERLAPRDPDLRANLRFARETANARGERPAWRTSLRRLTLNEWTALACGVLWIWFGLLTLGRIRPSTAAALRGWRRLACLAFVFTGGTLAAACVDRFGEREAVIIARESVVRFGPFDESQSHYTLRDGAEVIILDESPGWTQIKDGQSRIGWVKREQLVFVGAPRIEPKL